MLKSEIRRLYQDKNDIRKDIISTEKSTNIIERKFMLAKEMLEKLQTEKKKLLKSNFELKKRADVLEAKYNQQKILQKRSVESTRMPALPRANMRYFLLSKISSN